jgi:hypothetical protein
VQGLPPNFFFGLQSFYRWAMASLSLSAIRGVNKAFTSSLSKTLSSTSQEILQNHALLENFLSIELFERVRTTTSLPHLEEEFAFPFECLRKRSTSTCRSAYLRNTRPQLRHESLHDFITTLHTTSSRSSTRFSTGVPPLG